MHLYGCREFGKTLFWDESTLKVPFLAADPTEEAFVSDLHPGVGELLLGLPSLLNFCITLKWQLYCE